MNKYILTLLILVTPYLVNAQVSNKYDMKGKIGLSLYGGPNVPAVGNYSSTVKTTDYLKVGSRFGIGVSYFFTKGLGIEGTFSAAYNPNRSTYKPVGKEPLWANASASINAIYNFGHMFRNPYVAPFVRIGAGSYTWEQFEDGLIEGGINKETKNHSVSSRGFNVGAGAEYSMKKNFTIGVLLDYNVFYPKYENQLENTGTSKDEHTAIGFLSPQIKLSYYFPTGK
jgi:opacity protein-like surface antigen